MHISLLFIMQKLLTLYFCLLLIMSLLTIVTFNDYKLTELICISLYILIQYVQEVLTQFI